MPWWTIKYYQNPWAGCEVRKIWLHNNFYMQNMPSMAVWQYGNMHNMHNIILILIHKNHSPGCALFLCWPLCAERFVRQAASLSVRYPKHRPVAPELAAALPLCRCRWGMLHSAFIVQLACEEVEGSLALPVGSTCSPRLCTLLYLGSGSVANPSLQGRAKSRSISRFWYAAE